VTLLHGCQAVILLFQHDETGSSGLILNRRTSFRIESLKGATMLCPYFAGASCGLYVCRHLQVISEAMHMHNPCWSFQLRFFALSAFRFHTTYSTLGGNHLRVGFKRLCCCADNPLNLGGDVGGDMLHVLHCHSDVPHASEVINGIFIGSPTGAVEVVQNGQHPASDFRSCPS
jgi:Uncharacterized ACR, COG1678